MLWLLVLVIVAMCKGGGRRPRANGHIPPTPTTHAPRQRPLALAPEGREHHLEPGGVPKLLVQYHVRLVDHALGLRESCVPLRVAPDVVAVGEDYRGRVMVGMG